MVFALSKPAALLGGVSEGGEYALTGGGITAFKDERAVDCGLLFHCLSSFREWLSVDLSVIRFGLIVK
jgi:hypothetical protein